MYGATSLPEHVHRPHRHGRDRDAACSRAAPTHTTMVTDYLFRPEVIDEPGFDPSEVVDFAELVARQDYDVCERVQLGVRSRAFTHGVYAEKDELPYKFNEDVPCRARARLARSSSERASPVSRPPRRSRQPAST